jgi:phosphatidate cytidylyltransferase
MNLKSYTLAINISTLKTRALTAVFFVIIMLLGLLTNAWAFIALFLVVLVGCLLEFSKIIKLIYGRRYFFYSSFSLIYIFMPVLMMLDLGVDIEDANGDFIFQYSPLFPCAIIFSVWINDTMAYLVGSLIGKTPFSRISPKKTWEGTIGGAILCVAILGLAGRFIPGGNQLDTIDWIILSSLIALFGTLGDLFESKLKRTAGLKDSGRILPGHGGFLDRFDSMLIATPFAWFFIRIFLISGA